MEHFSEPAARAAPKDSSPNLRLHHSTGQGTLHNRCYRRTNRSTDCNTPVVWQPSTRESSSCRQHQLCGLAEEYHTLLQEFTYALINSSSGWLFRLNALPCSLHPAPSSTHPSPSGRSFSDGIDRQDDTPFTKVASNGGGWHPGPRERSYERYGKFTLVVEDANYTAMNATKDAKALITDREARLWQVVWIQFQKPHKEGRKEGCESLWVQE